jgi:hypothetical protein
MWGMPAWPAYVQLRLAPFSQRPVASGELRPRGRTDERMVVPSWIIDIIIVIINVAMHQRSSSSTFINVQRNRVHRRCRHQHRDNPENAENAEKCPNRPKVGGNPWEPEIGHFGPRGPPGPPREFPEIRNFRNFPPALALFWRARKCLFFRPRKPPFLGPFWGLVWYFFVVETPILGVSSPWRPTRGPPRRAGGAKKCTFIWVFNNSPSRDKTPPFFPLFCPFFGVLKSFSVTDKSHTEIAYLAALLGPFWPFWPPGPLFWPIPPKIAPEIRLFDLRVFGLSSGTRLTVGRLARGDGCDGYPLRLYCAMGGTLPSDANHSVYVEGGSPRSGGQDALASTRRRESESLPEASARPQRSPRFPRPTRGAYMGRGLTLASSDLSHGLSDRLRSERDTTSQRSA